MSQRELAEKLGFSARHINFVLQGRVGVTAQFAVRFAKLAGINPRVLLYMQADEELRKLYADLEEGKPVAPCNDGG